MFVNANYLTNKQAKLLSDAFTEKKIRLFVSVDYELILSLISLQALCEKKKSPELIAYLSNHPAVTLALTETVKYLTLNPSAKKFRVRMIEVNFLPYVGN
jgi:hypothetical protein